MPERNRHVEAHRGFTAGLKEQQVALWTALADAWDEDDGLKKTAANPYEVENTSELLLPRFDFALR